MSGPKTPATTTQIQKVELPAWVDTASQQNYKKALKVTGQKWQSYTGDRTADLGALELAAPGTLQQGMDNTNASLGEAADFARGVRPITAQQVHGPGGVADVTAQSFLSRDINAYMNPEINNVVNATRSNMQRDIDLGVQGVADETRGAGAWGGSRHGIREAVFAAEGARNIGQTEAQMRGAAYDRAAGLIHGDNALALQAAQGNQQSGLTTQAQQLQAHLANQGADLQAQTTTEANKLASGSLLSQIGQQYSDTAGRNALLQSQFGATERAIRQQDLDNKYENWQGKRNEGLNDLNVRLAALGMSPYGKTTSTEGTSTSESSSNGMLTGIGAAATILPLLFSDRKTKKNVKKIGKVGDTDLNAYKFEYKKGFMGRDTGPQIGLMAQDVEKKVPGAVHKVKTAKGTVKAVDYGEALSKAPRDKRDDKGKARGTYKPRRIGVGGFSRAA